MESVKYGLEKIIPDVLDHLIDGALCFEIKEILKYKESNMVFDWDNIIKRNEKFKDDYTG